VVYLLDVQLLSEYRNLEFKKKESSIFGEIFDENLLEDGVSILIADDDGPQSI
jgi:hypothetical protein